MYQEKLTGHIYARPDDFAQDVRLTFTNAIRYNECTEHAVHQAATVLLQDFDDQWANFCRPPQVTARAVDVCQMLVLLTMPILYLLTDEQWREGCVTEQTKAKKKARRFRRYASILCQALKS